MTGFAVNHLASGGVITNYHCASRCGHCLYNCGPHRPRDFLDAAMAGKIFRLIIQHGCRSVHIGGGEPLLRPRQLATFQSPGQLSDQLTEIDSLCGTEIDCQPVASLTPRLLQRKSGSQVHCSVSQ